MVNRVFLVGNVGKKPEYRETQNGSKVCSFSLATNRFVSGKTETDWHNVVCFDKTAELVNKYVDKGSTICVEGYIKYNKYEKDGQNRVNTQIIANSIQFLSRDKKQSESNDVSKGTSSDQIDERIVNSQTVYRQEEDEIPF